MGAVLCVNTLIYAAPGDPGDDGTPGVAAEVQTTAVTTASQAQDTTWGAAGTSGTVGGSNGTLGQSGFNANMSGDNPSQAATAGGKGGDGGKGGQSGASGDLNVTVNGAGVNFDFSSTLFGAVGAAGANGGNAAKGGAGGGYGMTYATPINGANGGGGGTGGAGAAGANGGKSTFTFTNGTSSFLANTVFGGSGGTGGTGGVGGQGGNGGQGVHAQAGYTDPITETVYPNHDGGNGGNGGNGGVGGVGGAGGNGGSAVLTVQNGIVNFGSGVQFGGNGGSGGVGGVGGNQGVKGLGGDEEDPNFPGYVGQAGADGQAGSFGNGGNGGKGGNAGNGTLTVNGGSVNFAGNVFFGGVAGTGGTGGEAGGSGAKSGTKGSNGSSASGSAFTLNGGTVNLGGDLTFRGSNNSMTVGSGSTLAYDANRGINLGSSGTLTLNGGSSLARTATSGILSVVADTVTGPSSGKITLDVLGNMNSKSDFLTTSTAGTNLTTASFDVSGYGEGGATVYQNGNTFSIEIFKVVQTLYWTGNDTTWEANRGETTQGWSDGQTTPTYSDFTTGDTVNFALSGTHSVTLSGQSVAPEAVKVSNGNYTFTGSAALVTNSINVSGNAGLTLDNTGTNVVESISIAGGSSLTANRETSLGNAAVANSGTVNIHFAGTVGNVFSGTGALDLSNADGLVILSANNTQTGTLTVGSNGVDIGNGGTSGSYVGNINSTGTVTFNRSDSYNYAGTLSGSGSTDVKAGNLVLQEGAQITSSGTTTVSSGATLDVTGAQDATKAAFQGGKLTVNSGGTLRTTFVDYTMGAGSELRVYLGNAMTGFTNNGTATTVANRLYKVSQDLTYGDGKLYYILKRNFSSDLFPNLSPQIGPVIDSYGGGNDFIENLMTNVDDDDVAEVAVQSSFDLVNLSSAGSALYDARTGIANAIYLRSRTVPVYSHHASSMFLGQSCGVRRPMADAWMTPIYGNGRGFGLNSGNFQYGYVNDQYAVAFGFDGVRGTTRSGIMGVGGWGNVHSNGSTAKTRNETGFGGVYVYSNACYGDVDLLLSAGWLGMNHSISQENIDGNLTGNMDSGMVSLSATLTQTICLGGLHLSPTIGLEYGYYYQNAMDVSWGGQTAFRNDASHANMLVLPVGLLFTHNARTMDGGLLTTELRTRYIANVGDVDSNYDVWMTGSPASALMATRMTDRNAGDLGVGLGWNRGWTNIRGDFGYLFSECHQDMYYSVMFGWKF